MAAAERRESRSSARRKRLASGRRSNADLPEVPAGFHYDRQRRLSMPSAPTRARSRGWLRGNRGLRILLLDIVVIAILVVVASRLLQGDGAADRIDEFAVRAAMEQRDGTSLLTVTISNERIFGRSAPGAVVARLSVLSPRSGSGSDAVRLTAERPRGSGQSVDMRAMLRTPDESGAQTQPVELLVRVSIGDRSVALVLPVAPGDGLTPPGGRE